MNSIKKFKDAVLESSNDRFSKYVNRKTGDVYLVGFGAGHLP